MGYLDGLVDPQFRIVSGKKVWYPWGKMGKGYIISDKQEQEARAFVAQYYIVSFSLATAFVFILKQYEWAVIYIIISTVYFWYKVKDITKNSQRIKDTSTFNERLKMQAKSMGFRTALIMFFSMLATSLLIGSGFLLGIRDFWYIVVFIMTLLLVIYSFFVLKYSRQ